MVSREVSFPTSLDNNNFEDYLEETNPFYKLAREQYNSLIGKTLNPLSNNGLSGDKNTFIIILLEKILRNTEILFEQNTFLKSKTETIEQGIIQIKHEGLNPIIQAGHNINTELKRFEEGFQAWNIKFDTWNLGFKDFEENLLGTNKFLKDFSEYWIGKTEQIQNNLVKIEHHITQWNDEVIRVNNTIQDLEKRFFIFEQKQSEILTPRQTFTTDLSSKETQKYKVLPSNNHKWKL